MTEQEVNKILATFEGRIFNNIKYTNTNYTTDWNDFHRVWMKFNEMGLLNKQIIFDILQQPTPSLAAHKLAEIVKQTPHKLGK